MSSTLSSSGDDGVGGVGSSGIHTMWTAHWHEGRRYYYNQETQESSWEPPPEGFIDTPAPTGTNSADDNETRLQQQQQQKRGEENQEPMEQDAMVMDKDTQMAHWEDEREGLISKLAQRDGIMEIDIKDSIIRWMSLNESLGKDSNTSAKELVNLLASNYHGYSDMSSMVISWLDSMTDSIKSPEVLLPTFMTNNNNNNNNNNSNSNSNSNNVMNGSSGVATYLSHLPLGQRVAMEHLHSQIFQKFSPESCEKLLDQETPPEWLLEMLEQREWRHLLITLAEANKSVPLLDFALKVIVKSNYYEDVSAMTSASQYFIAFRKSLERLIERLVLADNEAEFIDIEAQFVKLCSHSQIAYSYAMQVLYYLEESFTSTTSNLQYRFRRLRQSSFPDVTLANAIICDPISWRNRSGLASPVSQGGFPDLSNLLQSSITSSSSSNSSSTKFRNVATFTDETLNRLRKIYDPALRNPNDPIPPLWPLMQRNTLEIFCRILFRPNFDSNAVVFNRGAWSNACFLFSRATTREDAPQTELNIRFEELKEATNIAGDKKTLAYGFEPKALDRLSELVKKSSPVSIGVLHWVRSCLAEENFQKTKEFSKRIPTLLKLVRISIENYPLQHQHAFFVLTMTFEHQAISSEDRVTILSEIITHFHSLIIHGYVLPVIDYMRIRASDVGSMDYVLIRKFLEGLLRIANPPFSPEFQNHTVMLLNVSDCLRAINHAGPALKQLIENFRRSIALPEDIPENKNDRAMHLVLKASNINNNS